MSRWNIGGAMVSGTLLFLVAMIGLFLVHLHRIDQRLVLVERALAAPRIARPLVFLAAPPLAGVPAALDGNARRLRALMRTLERRVDDVAARVDTVDIGSGVAPASAPETDPPRPAPRAPAPDADVPDAGAASPQPLPGGAAAYRDWLGVELAKVVDALGLTPGQRAAGEAMIADLVREHFGADLNSQDLGARWASFSRAWEERLTELMTAEQRERYAELSRRRRLDQMSATVQWTVSGVTDACELTPAQKDRLRERLRGLFTSVYLGAGPGSDGGAAPADPAAWRARLRGLVQEEVTVDQLARFEEWFENNLEWGEAAAPESAGR